MYFINIINNYIQSNTFLYVLSFKYNNCKIKILTLHITNKKITPKRIINNNKNIHLPKI